MCENSCGKCAITFFYIYFLIVGSGVVLYITLCKIYQFPDDSIFKNDEVYISNDGYYPIHNFPNLEEIYKNYSSNIYYQRKYDLNTFYNLLIIPAFVILSIIFGSCFICCKYEKVWFGLINIFTIIIQVAPFLNKILYSDKRIKNLPDLEMDDVNFYSIFEDYEDYKKLYPEYFNYIIIGLLGAQFIIWFLVLILKKSDDSENEPQEKNKCKRCSIFFYIVFGLISTGIFSVSPFLYYPCKNRYSNYFLSDRYEYSRKEVIRVSEYENYEYNNIIETYYYEDYPYLEEIYNIYYKTNSDDEKIKVKVDYKNIGIIFFFLAVVGMPALAIVSFILLICFKSKDKGHKGFVVFEILSILLKIFIIIYPYIWIKNKFRKNIVNNNEQIKHIINDYLNYSNCRNKFPVVLMIEFAYLFFEILAFCVTFAGTCGKEQINPIPHPQQNPNPSSVVVIHDIVERNIEPKYVALKFKDNLNNNYEIKADTKRRFYDVLCELIGKYEFLRKRKIISVSEGNRNLHSNQMPCLLTLEELELADNSGIINIVLENNEEQQVLTINKPKLAPLPKLKFCIINMGNRTIEIDKKDVTFETALETLRTKDKDLNNKIFEPIFYYDRGEKIYIDNIRKAKKINELQIPKDTLIFIKVNEKDNTLINIKFIWVNQNSQVIEEKKENTRTFDFKTGKKEKFHSVANEFMASNNEFITNIITKFYFKKIDNNNENINQLTSTIENLNTMKTENPNTQQDLIETENENNFYTLEELGIYDGSIIYFETRPNMIMNNLQINNMNSLIFNSLLMVNELKDQGKKMLYFTITDCPGQIFTITVNEKDKFRDALFVLQRDYPIFKGKIKTALANGKNFMLEEYQESEVKDLPINDTDKIFIYMDYSGNTPAK